MKGALQVDLKEPPVVAHGIGHQGSQVDDGIYSPASIGQALTGGQIASDNLHIQAVEARQQGIGTQHKSPHTIAARQQLAGSHVANAAGCACYQYLHKTSFPHSASRSPIPSAGLFAGRFPG